MSVSNALIVDDLHKNILVTFQELLLETKFSYLYFCLCSTVHNTLMLAYS